MQVGSTKMYFSLSQLEKGAYSKQDTFVTHKPISQLKSSTVIPELNLLGYSVEEARLTLDKYLDDCVLANLSTVRIIHGKGTGALR